VFGALVASLRPRQWTKNLLVFAGVLFGRRLLDPVSVMIAGATFLVFCALSGAVYLFNDVADREADREHPLKRMRPIASGNLSARAALIAAGVLGAAALAASIAIRPALGAASAAYLILLVLYSTVLKHIVIVDVLTIAAGFVLRAVAGALVLDINITYWLLMCMGLLAIFLGLAKRRAELVLLDTGAGEHRRILDEYSLPMLDQMISIITASTIIAYTLFTTSAETLPRKPFPIMLVTVPLVIYLIFRYLYLMYKHGEGGSPADLVLKDVPFICAGALWGTLVLAILALAPR